MCAFDLHGKNPTWCFMASVAELSDYFYTQQECIKKRYKQKIALLNVQDPYVLAKKKLLDKTDSFPDFR